MIPPQRQDRACSCTLVHYYRGTGDGPYCTHCGGLVQEITIPASEPPPETRAIRDRRRDREERRERAYELRRERRLKARAEARR